MYYLEILLNLGHTLTKFDVHVPCTAWHYFPCELGDFPNKFENLSTLYLCYHNNILCNTFEGVSLNKKMYMHIINEICKKIWKDQPSSCKVSFPSSFISLVSLIVTLVMSLILFIISLIHFRKWSVIWPPKPIGIFNPSMAILFPKTLFILLSVTVCCNCTFSLQISFSMQ